MPCVSIGSRIYLGYLSFHAKQSLLCPVCEVVLPIGLNFIPFTLKICQLPCYLTVLKSQF